MHKKQLFCALGAAFVIFLPFSGTSVSAQTNSAEAPASTKPQKDICKEKQCAPLPQKYRAFFVDRVEGEDYVDLQLPPANPKLNTLKNVPKDLKLTYLRASGGRDMGEYRVEIGHSAKAEVTKSGLSTSQTGSIKIPEQKLLELLHQFGAIGFMDITSESLNKTCKTSMTHAATVSLSLRFQTHSHTIKYYAGCNPGKKSDTQLALKKLSENLRRLTKGARLSEPKPLHEDVDFLE